MSADQDSTSKFSNHRQWREFIRAVHESEACPGAASYPNAISSRHSAGSGLGRQICGAGQRQALRV
jgi:hypothetical protein